MLIGHHPRPAGYCPTPAEVQVLANVAQRLAELHAGGYVHRDLKPANIMWLPREDRWALIDFGCVARAGVCAPLRFSLAYAAPEVVATAMQPESPGIVADATFDAWSLGVIAYELLLGERAFGNNVLTKSEVPPPIQALHACVTARLPTPYCCRCRAWSVQSQCGSLVPRWCCTQGSAAAHVPALPRRMHPHPCNTHVDTSPAELWSAPGTLRLLRCDVSS